MNILEEVDQTHYMVLIHVFNYHVLSTFVT